MEAVITAATLLALGYFQPNSFAGSGTFAPPAPGGGPPPAGNYITTETGDPLTAEPSGDKLTVEP